MKKKMKKKQGFDCQCFPEALCSIFPILPLKTFIEREQISNYKKKNLNK